MSHTCRSSDKGEETITATGRLAARRLCVHGGANWHSGRVINNHNPYIARSYTFISRNNFYHAVGAHSASAPLRRRLGEVRHDVACEASQTFAAACAAARAATVEQHLSDPDVAQRLEPLRDLVGSAVHGADFVNHPRVTGGPVRPAMDRTVRSSR